MKNMGISIECEAKSMENQSVLNEAISRLSPIYAAASGDTGKSCGARAEHDAVDSTDGRHYANGEALAVAAATTQQVSRDAFTCVCGCEFAIFMWFCFFFSFVGWTIRE